MKSRITSYKTAAAYRPISQLVVIGVTLYLMLFAQELIAQDTPGRRSPDNKTSENGAVSKPSPVLSGVASVGDFVWIDSNDNGLQDTAEQGVPNVLVVLYDSMLNIVATKYTDNAGHYSFDSIAVPESNGGSFRVGFYNIPPNYAYSKQVLDSIYMNSNSKLDPITGRTKPFRLLGGTVRNDIDGGIKSAPGIVLPLTIDQFNGAYANGFIQLRWTTFTEINIDHFDIERSTDGVDFRKLGTVSASGAGEEGNTNYSYSDVMAEKGSNFYRLVIIDNDGNYTYSKAITVGVDVKGISVSVVYPNPFSKRVQVRMVSMNPEQVTIRVIDNAGTVVRTQLANVERGENNIVIQNVAELPGGVYYLEVIADHRTMKTKLMKQ